MPEKRLIFVSHAHVDLRFIDVLQRLLVARGVDAWVDRQKLVGGNDWSVGLRDAIQRCDALVLVLSPAAMASDAVRQEYQYALELGKPILPILYQPVRTLPPELATLHWFDCSGRDSRGLYDLVYTLDTYGARDAQPAGTFDGDLALARALRNELPPSWQIARVQPAWYLRRMLICTLLALCTLAIAIYGILLLLILPISQGARDVAIFTLVVGVVLLEEYVLIRRAFFSRLLAAKSMPELIVAGEDGFVLCQHRFWGIATRRVIAYSYAGADRIEARMHGKHRGALTLWAKSPPTRHTVVFPSQFGATDRLALQIAATFAQRKP